MGRGVGQHSHARRTSSGARGSHFMLETTMRRDRHVILVVDDDHDLRESLREILEEEGFETIGASDGKEAVDLLLSGGHPPPRVILLDIMMPGISGWEVTAELLADRSTDQIPIIFISARSELSDRVRAFELGAQAYLTKPFYPAVLAETVTTVLDQIERGDREAALAETLATLRKGDVTTTKPSPS